MRESLMYGSVRGARGNSRPYRNRRDLITLLGGAPWIWSLAAQRAAAGHAGHRFPRPHIARHVRGSSARISPRPQRHGLYRGRERDDPIPLRGDSNRLQIAGAIQDVAPSSVVKIRYHSSRDRAPLRQLKFLGLRGGRSVESSRQSRRSHPQPVSMKAPDLGCRGFVAQLSAHLMRGCRRAPLVLHPTPIASGSLCKIAHST
jgi:hypothetical protein